MKLVQLLHAMERWANVIQLSSALLKHLEGAEFKMPFIFSDSPIEGMNEELDKERVSDDDVHKFLEEN